MATIALPQGTAQTTRSSASRAVDGSQASADAVREALRFATAAPQLSFVAVDTAAARGSLGERRSLRALGAAQAAAGARGLVACTELVRCADIGGTLVSRAGPRGLLVAGGHGDGRASGSVTRALLASAAGPLLVARRATGLGGERPEVLAVVDDGPTAVAVVALAGALASSCGGYVHLLHIGGPGYGTASRHRLAEHAIELIGLTRAEPVVDVLDSGHVAGTVARFARCSEAGLLVVSRGRTMMRRSPSVGEQIVHLSPCSVLVVPVARTV